MKKCALRFRQVMSSVAIVAMASAIGPALAQATADRSVEPLHAAFQTPPPTGIKGNTYTSPTYGFRLTWDQQIWQPVSGSEIVASEPDLSDRLMLQYEGGDGFVLVDGRSLYLGDPATCLAGEERNLRREDAVIQVDLATGEDGQPLTGSDATGAFAVFAVTVHDPVTNADTPWIQYVECFTLEPGRSVIVFRHNAFATHYNSQVDAVQRLLANLHLPELTPETSVPTGIDGPDSYTSPTYGYRLRWDTASWTPMSAAEKIGDGPTRLDLLMLWNGASALYIQGLTGFGGAPQACLDAQVRALEQEEGTEEILPRADAAGDTATVDADGSVFAVYDTTIVPPEGGPTQEQAIAIACRTLRPGQAVLLVTLVTDRTDYDRDLPAALDVLAALDFPDIAATALRRVGNEPATTIYTSPSHGYSLRWASEDWVVDEDSSEAGRDRLQLRSADGEGWLLVTTSRLAPDAGLNACVEDASSQLLATAANAEPIATTTGDPARVAAAYRLELEAEDFRAYVECRPLGPVKPMVLAVYLAPAAEYEIHLPLVLEMIGGIGPAEPTVATAPGILAASLNTTPGCHSPRSAIRFASNHAISTATFCACSVHPLRMC